MQQGCTIVTNNSTLLSQNTSFPGKITFLVFFLSTSFNDTCRRTIPKLWSDSCNGISWLTFYANIVLPTVLFFMTFCVFANFSFETVCRSRVTAGFVKTVACTHLETERWKKKQEKMGEVINVPKHRKCKRKGFCFVSDKKHYAASEPVEIMCVSWNK